MPPSPPLVSLWVLQPRPRGAEQHGATKENQNCLSWVLYFLFLFFCPMSCSRVSGASLIGASL